MSSYTSQSLTFAPLGSPSYLFDVCSQGTYRVKSGQTVGNVAGMYVYNTFDSSNLGTTTACYGMLIGAGTSSSGTITNAYGLNINAPAFGTNKYCLTIAGVSSTVAGGNSFRGLDVEPQMGCSTGTLTSAPNIYVYPNYLSNVATITTAYGMWIDTGTSVGTITNSYGLYVAQPAYGTNKYCGYFGGGIGVGTTPPTSAGITLPTSEIILQ